MVDNAKKEYFAVLVKLYRSLKYYFQCLPMQSIKRERWWWYGNKKARKKTIKDIMHHENYQQIVIFSVSTDSVCIINHFRHKNKS